MDNYAADVDEEAAGKFNFTMFCQVRSDGLQFESGQYALPKTTFFFKYRYTFLRHPCFNLMPVLADQDLNVCIHKYLIFASICVKVAAKFMIEDDEEQMKEELKEAFRIYDKEGQGFITTDVLKVELPSRAGNKPSRSFVASSISDAQIIGHYQ